MGLACCGWDGWLWWKFLGKLLSIINNAECTYPGRSYVLKLNFIIVMDMFLGQELFEIFGDHGHWASGRFAVHQWAPHTSGLAALSTELHQIFGI